MSPRRGAVGVLLAAVVATPVAARAQDLPVGRVRFLSGVEARGVSFNAGLGLKSISEVAIPFGALWTASPKLSFDFGVRYATATRAPEADSLPSA